MARKSNSQNSEEKVAGSPILEKDQAYIEKLEKHITKASEVVTYSIVRFDLLIISLSTAALLFTSSYFKDIKTVSHVSSLKTAWLLFTITIIANLLSQVTGYLSNIFDIKVSEVIIRNKKKSTREERYRFKDWLCVGARYATHILNLISLLLFIAAVIMLVKHIDLQF